MIPQELNNRQQNPNVKYAVSVINTLHWDFMYYGDINGVI